MYLSIESQIIERIKKAKRGTLFFGQDFSMQGNNDAVRKSLERLVKKGEIERVATGIYARPEIDPIVGKCLQVYKVSLKPLQREIKPELFLLE